MLLLTTACGQTEDVLLFSEETYQHDVICSVQVSAQEAAVITQFTEEMTEAMDLSSPILNNVSYGDGATRHLFNLFNRRKENDK